jgi:hypothetical protein
MDNFEPNRDDAVNEQHRVLMEFLSNNDEMKKATKNSLKFGLLAGGGAVAGGMLLGPVGGLIGGVTGSMIGFMQSDPYNGIVQQLVALEMSRKAQLMDAVKATLVDAGALRDSNTLNAFSSAEAFRETLSYYASQRTVRDQIWKLCMDAIHN